MASSGSSVPPMDASSINVGWDPSALQQATPDGAFDPNVLIERTREVKVDANDYSRFKDVGADEEEDRKDTAAKIAPAVASEATCRNCSKPGAKLKCSVCKKAVYCARKCQASDWTFHKRICKKPEPPKKKDPPRRPASEARSTSSSSSTKKTASSGSSKPKASTSSSSPVVVADEPDMSSDMRGYKNGLPYFHRELSKEEKHLIGDIAPQKIETAPAAVRAPHDGSAWNTAGTFEERVVTKWAEVMAVFRLACAPEKWSALFSDATFSEGNFQATLKAPEKFTGEASICVVRGKKRYLFDFNFQLPFEVAISGGSSCKGTYTMNDISNDEDYEVGSSTSPKEVDLSLTKKPSSATELKAVQTFVGSKSSGLQKELVRLITEFAQDFQQQ
ncbi:hypothetical protein BBJ28_00008478 [Nothophytophthora sp. Chile5]|nr:hypothetical protein BBJ28_00008478 [Nothophytophthora sp. Chile5]